MRQRHLIRGSWLVSMLAALMLGGVLGSADIAAADSGPTVTAADGLCMQRIFIGNDTGSVTGSNALNCTAEDIKISAVEEGTCTGPNCFSATECIDGLDFTLVAKFALSVTANSRYDATFFFRTDGVSETQIIKGQPQEVGAYGSGTDAEGECSLSWLTPPPRLTPPC